MSIYVEDRYRIKRNIDQEDRMKYLIQDLNIFQSYSQILVVSAIIGYNNNAYVEFSKSAEAVQMGFFSDRSYDIMDFIAYARVKEQSILTKQEKYTIFECYANGGFEILANKLGVDFIDKSRNNRLDILRNYYMLLLFNGFNMDL